MSGTIEIFKAEHLAEVEWTGGPIAKTVGFDVEFAEIGRKYAENGMGITVRHNDDIIACMGVVLLWKGVGEVWCFTAPDARKHPTTLCKAALWGIEQGIKQLSLHRVQAHVLMDFKAALRWIKYLGFTQEGVCLAYTADGQDVARFSRGA